MTSSLGYDDEADWQSQMAQLVHQTTVNLKSFKRTSKSAELLPLPFTTKDEHQLGMDEILARIESEPDIRRYYAQSAYEAKEDDPKALLWIEETLRHEREDIKCRYNYL